jgi:phosphoribosyl-AMP cyclohydrolase
MFVKSASPAPAWAPPGAIVVEEALAALQFDAQGLIPAVAQDATDGRVLMLAWMNREAVRATLESGRVTYWSRSRGALWRKGDTSGHTQRLVNFRIDCDGDSILLLVEQVGAACHTNRHTCFYRELGPDEWVEIVGPNVKP